MRVVILTTGDLGRSYRLLRHAKSYHEIENNQVILIGPELTSMPRELTQARNVRHVNLSIIPYSFPWSVMLVPISFIWRIVQVFMALITVFRADIIMTSTANNLGDSILAWLGKYILGAKLILEISPFRHACRPKDESVAILRVLESQIPKLADEIIVSTNAMHVMLKVMRMESHVIQDEPGTNFRPRPEQRAGVAKLLGNEEPIISVPLPILNVDTRQKLISLIQRLDRELSETVNLVVFCGGKLRAGFEQDLEKLQLRHTNIHVFSMYTDIYSHILGVSDLGLCFAGSQNGLDITPELLEMVASGVPTIVYRYGSVIEYVKHGETGFVFSSDDELSAILQQIFVKKSMNLAIMRKNCEQRKLRGVWQSEWQAKMLHQKLD